MVPAHPAHLPLSSRRRHPERVPFALNHEHGQIDRIQLPQAALGWVVRLSRRVEGKGQAEHGDRAGRRGGPASDTSARRASPDDQAKAPQLTSTQIVNHGSPGGVQLVGRGRRAAAGDAIWLLDQGHAHAELSGGLAGRHQVWGVDTATRPVTQDEARGGGVGASELDTRRAVRSADCSGAGYTAVSSHSARSQFASSSEMPSSRWM
jgi:hypothetical protein